MPHRLKSSFELNPTFPLELSEIKKRALNAKLLHPLTLGVGGACLGLALLLNAGVFGFVGLLGIGAVGLVAWWQQHAAPIEAKVIQDMIHESNQAQDRQLANVVAQYRQWGLHHYASALGKFFLVKQRIENELHDDGTLTENKKQIDRLIDHICGAVCRQFHKLTELDRSTAASLTSGSETKLNELDANRSEILERIMHAYNTMYETLEHVIQCPASGPTPPTLDPSITGNDKDANLDDVVSQLKEENRINRAVQERLEIRSASPEDPDYHAFDDSLSQPGDSAGESERLEAE
jgi:hypothetical protein